jgi:hypothetical protein
MSIAAVNPQYFAQNNPTSAANSAFAQGQIPSQGGVSGTQSRALIGLGTAVLDGAATTFTLNWIDGIQTPYKNAVLVPFSAVTAPAIIGGVSNQAVYSGVGAYGQFRVGQSIVFAGFTNAGNNGTFTINAVATSSITVTNASSVAESNPAATGSVNQGTVLALGRVTRAQASAAGVLDTAAQTITTTISVQTQTSCTVTLSGTGSALQTLSVMVELYPAV